MGKDTAYEPHLYDTITSLEQRITALERREIVPIGSIVSWGGSSENIPPGFLLADGSEVLRESQGSVQGYSELFGVIGDTFGAGDGYSTFNLPSSTVNVIADQNLWQFVYQPSVDPTYPWSFVGGPPRRSEQTADQTLSSVLYVDGTNTLPAVTAPYAGVYKIHWGARMDNDTAGGYSFMTIKNGSAASSDAEGLLFQAGAANVNQMHSYTRNFTATSANNVFKAQYRNGSGTAHVFGIGAVSSSPAFLEITPVRVAFEPDFQTPTIQIVAAL